jgi:hypothetical protein
MAKRAKRPLRVFLCHATADKPAVHTLYDHLLADGFDAWLDEEKLLPGQNWREEIPKAVRDSEIILVCLSRHSINKEGYVQKEIKIALDTADEKPEGTIFIIPARLDDCKVPDRLRIYQWVDLYKEDGYEKILRALTVRANQIRRKSPSKTGKTALAKTASHTEARQGTSLVNPVSLRKAISKAYSQPEFEILCSDMRVRYDDLRGSTLETKILDLITWHERRQKYDELVSKVLDDRPHLVDSLLTNSKPPLKGGWKGKHG